MSLRQLLAGISTPQRKRAGARLVAPQSKAIRTELEQSPSWQPALPAILATYPMNAEKTQDCLSAEMEQACTPKREMEGTPSPGGTAEKEGNKTLGSRVSDDACPARSLTRHHLTQLAMIQSTPPTPSTPSTMDQSCSLSPFDDLTSGNELLSCDGACESDVEEMLDSEEEEGTVTLHFPKQALEELAEALSGRQYVNDERLKCLVQSLRAVSDGEVLIPVCLSTLSVYHITFFELSVSNASVELAARSLVEGRELWTSKHMAAEDRQGILSCW